MVTSVVTNTEKRHLNTTMQILGTFNVFKYYFKYPKKYLNTKFKVLKYC